MGVKTHDLRILAYTNGFTMWHYRTDDNIGEVLENMYFSEAFDMLRPGDMVVINAGVTHTILFYTGMDREGETVTMKGMS